MTFSTSRAVLGDKQVNIAKGCCYFNAVLVLFRSSNKFVLYVSLGTLSSIPTALTRWTDECKVLDAESMHDCVAGRLVDTRKLVMI